MQSYLRSKRSAGSKSTKVTATAEFKKGSSPKSSVNSKPVTSCEFVEPSHMDQPNQVTIAINGLQVMSANSEQRITVCSARSYHDEDMASEATKNTVTMNIPANVPISIKSPKATVLQLTPFEPDEEDEVSMAVEDSVTSRNKTHVVNLTVRIKPTGEVSTIQGPLGIE